MLKRIKRITSHAGHARYLATVADEIVGYIPRQADIATPYAGGSSHIVWKVLETGEFVTIAETSHKRYDVFAVPAEMVEPNEDRIMAALMAE